MTNLTVNPVADSCVWHDAENSSLATLIAAAGNNLRGTYAGTFSCGLETSPTTTTNNFRYLRRGIFSFDTSSIPAGATITAATLTFRRSGGNNLLGDFDICVVGANPANPTTHAATDYATVGDTEFASRVAFTDWTYATDHTFTLNAAGRAHIAAGGYTTFALRIGWDVDGSFTGTWGTDKWSELQVYYRENEDYIPELSIDYTETNYVELSATCEAVAALTGTLSLVLSTAVIERKVGSGSFTEIAVIGWSDGTYEDTDSLEVGTIYTYRVKKVQQFSLPGPWSNEDAVQYDDFGVRLLEGAIAGVSTCTGLLSSITSTELARVERKTGDGEFVYYDLIDWADTPYYDVGPFEHDQTYTYRVLKIIAGYSSNPSNEVAVIYNQFEAVNMEGEITGTSQVQGSLDVPALAIIERKVGAGSYEVLAYVPYDPALYVDLGPFSEQSYSYRIKSRVTGADGEYSNVVVIDWVTPTYVLLEGAVVGATVLTSALSEYHFLSGSFSNESSLTGTLSQEYELAVGIAATSGLVGALTRVTPLRGSFAATSTLTGSQTWLRSITGTITATSGVTGAITRFVRLDGTITGTSRLRSTLRKKIAVAGEIASASAVKPALLRRKRQVSGALVALSGLAAPHLGVSAARIVISSISPIDAQADQSYLQTQYRSSHVLPFAGTLRQSQVTVIYSTGHVAAITASVEGYIYAKNLLELMIGEGPFIIKVDEMPLDTEYAESDYEEEKTT